MHLRSFWVVYALAALVSLALLLPALSAARYVDDFYIHARVAGRLGEPTVFRVYEFFWTTERVHQLRDVGFLPWWTDDALRLRFFRPLTSATHYLDWLLFQSRPIPSRIHSLVWLLFLLAGAGVLFRRWLAPGAAGLALFMYAIAGHHGLSSVWIAARHALVSGAFGTLAIWAWLRWKEDGARGHATTWVLASLLALAGGEVGLGALVFAAAHALFAQPGGPGRRVARALLPGAITVTYLALYVGLGFGARGSDAYVEPLGSPLQFLGSGLGRWLAMLGQLLLGAPANAYVFDDARPALYVAGALGLLVFAVAFFALRPGRGDAPTLGTPPGWLIVASVLSLVPAGAAVPGGRALPLAALGSTAVVAAVLYAAVKRWRAGQRPPWWVLPALGLLGLGGLIVSPVVRFSFAATLGRSAGLQARVSQRWRAPCSEQELRVLLSAPDFSAGIYGPLQLSEARGEPVNRFRLVSMAPFDVEVTPSGQHRLEVRAPPNQAFFRTVWEQVHGREVPRMGETVRQGDLAITVLEARKGRPVRLEVQTDAPLGQVCWLTWKDGTFRRIALPPIGATMVLPSEPGPLALP